ncbi:MAG: hypothetical protein WC947_02760 [Elusimicrobiota bacterium]
MKRTAINCANYLVDGKCDDWIIKIFSAKEHIPDKKIEFWGISESNKADEICSKCQNFESK